jgi:hypothetical protein
MKGSAHHHRRITEHQRADLHRADAGQFVQLAYQRLPSILVRGDVRLEFLRIDVDRVAADRQHQRNPKLVQFLTEIPGTLDAVIEVARIEHLIRIRSRSPPWSRPLSPPYAVRFHAATSTMLYHGEPGGGDECGNKAKHSLVTEQLGNGDQTGPTVALLIYFTAVNMLLRELK